IDQVLSRPCDPRLHERHVTSAADYVRLAERANGPIPTSVEFPYIWGAALDEFKRALPDARIINLETSITRSSAYIPKGINYRMSPENAGCLAATAACLATTTCSIGDVPDYATPWRLSSTCGSRPLGQAVMPPRRARRRSWKSPTSGAYWYFRLPQREVAPRQTGRQRAMLPV